MKLNFLPLLNVLNVFRIKNNSDKFILTVINFSIFISLGCLIGVIYTGYIEYKSSIYQEEYNSFYTKNSIINSIEIDYSSTDVYQMSHIEPQIQIINGLYDKNNPTEILEFIDLNYFYETYGITSLFEKLNTQKVLFENEDEILKNTDERIEELKLISNDMNIIVKKYQKIIKNELKLDEVRGYFNLFKKFNFRERILVIQDGANNDAIRLSKAIYSELGRLKIKMEELNTLSSQVFYIIFFGQLIIFLVFQSFEVISERRRIS